MGVIHQWGLRVGSMTVHASKMARTNSSQWGVHAVAATSIQQKMSWEAPRLPSNVTLDPPVKRHSSAVFSGLLRAAGKINLTR